MFTRNGKIVGGETIKPLLKAMPKADADALRARMETALRGVQGQTAVSVMPGLVPGIHVLAGKRKPWMAGS